MNSLIFMGNPLEFFEWRGNCEGDPLSPGGGSRGGKPP